MYRLCTSSLDAIAVLIVVVGTGSVVVAVVCGSLLFIKYNMNVFMESTTIFVFHLSINQSIDLYHTFFHLLYYLLMHFGQNSFYCICFGLFLSFVWNPYVLSLLYLWLLVIHFHFFCLYKNHTAVQIFERTFVTFSKQMPILYKLQRENTAFLFQCAFNKQKLNKISLISITMRLFFSTIRFCVRIYKKAI